MHERLHLRTSNTRYICGLHIDFHICSVYVQILFKKKIGEETQEWRKILSAENIVFRSAH